MLEYQKCKSTVLINKVTHKILNILYTKYLYILKENVLLITTKLSKVPEYKFGCVSYWSSSIDSELILKDVFWSLNGKYWSIRIWVILNLIFQEDLSEHIVQGDTLPGHVGTACLLSSTIAESGKSAGILTLPIMSRNSRKTIGKVRGKPGEAGWPFTNKQIKLGFQLVSNWAFENGKELINCFRILTNTVTIKTYLIFWKL